MNALIAATAPPQATETKYESVILIDDNRMDLMLNRSLLKKYNYARNLLAFLNAKNALIFLSQAYKMQLYKESAQPVIIFLDLYMPGMNGFEFLSTFDKFDQQFRKNFKIYLLSNCTNPFDLEKARYCRSIYGFIPKPLTHKILTF